MSGSPKQIDFIGFRNQHWHKPTFFRDLGDASALLQDDGTYTVYIRYRSDSALVVKNKVTLKWILATKQYSELLKK